MTLKEKAVVLIITLLIVALSTIVAGSYYIKAKERNEYAMLLKGSAEVAEAVYLYQLDHDRLPTEEDLNGRTLAQYLIDVGGDRYLSAIPKGVPRLSGDQGNMWVLKDGYIVTKISDAESCAKQNYFANGSESVEDIPTFSDSYSIYNPCNMK